MAEITHAMWLLADIAAMRTPVDRRFELIQIARPGQQIAGADKITQEPAVTLIRKATGERVTLYLRDAEWAIAGRSARRLRDRPPGPINDVDFSYLLERAEWSRHRRRARYRRFLKEERRALEPAEG